MIWHFFFCLYKIVNGKGSTFAHIHLSFLILKGVIILCAMRPMGKYCLNLMGEMFYFNLMFIIL